MPLLIVGVLVFAELDDRESLATRDPRTASRDFLDVRRSRCNVQFARLGQLEQWAALLPPHRLGQPGIVIAA